MTSATSQIDAEDNFWDSTFDEALQQGRTPYTLLDDAELEILDRAAREFCDAEIVHDWATFDDDERWRETARTGRAL